MSESFKNWLFSEMPISKFQLMGQWGPDAKRAYGYSKQDIDILQNPAAVDKIHRKWSNTHNEFDFYFLRSYKASKKVEVGEVDQEWVKENLDVDIEPREDSITIIFTQNTGTEKIPMTAWMIAHRLGHAVRRDKTHQEYFLKEVENDFVKLARSIYGEFYHYFGSPKELIALANAVGTMRSVRQSKLLNFAEFKYELIAQWIINGEIKFNPIPKNLIIRKRMAWGRPNHDYKYAKISDEELEEWNEMLEGYAEKYESYLNSIFSGLVGKMFVM